MGKLANLSGLEAAASLGISDNIWLPGHHGQKMTLEGAAVFLEALARNAFQGEVRRGGSPKVDHMAKAALPFSDYTKDHYVRRAIGWGHDLIEEIPGLTLKLLHQWGIPERIVSGIGAMTREVYDSYIGPKGKFVEIHPPYLDDFRKLMRNPDAAHVKIKGDIPDNMDDNTKGNKLYVYQIAMAYGIACIEGVITPDCSYKDFFGLVKNKKTGYEKLDAAVDIVKAIPRKAFVEVLRRECSEYKGPARDNVNYFDTSTSTQLRNICRRTTHRARGGLMLSLSAVGKLTRGVSRATQHLATSLASMVL